MKVAPPSTDALTVARKQRSFGSDRRAFHSAPTTPRSSTAIEGLLWLALPVSSFTRTGGPQVRPVSLEAATITCRRPSTTLRKLRYKRPRYGDPLLESKASLAVA